MITRRARGFRSLLGIELLTLKENRKEGRKSEVCGEYLAYYLNELGGLGGVW